jgi:glycosyltransferase involved in cell wall biosynthesis
MRICFFPRVGTGGPASFQKRLWDAFQHSGIEVTFSLEDRPLDAVLIFAGTRHLPALMKCRRQGIPIVQRLDGIHWLHRLPPYRPLFYARSEMRNLAQRFIRRTLADRIIYQSEFVHAWWERSFGKANAAVRVIHNGVPLADYPPRSNGHDGTLLVVEARLHHDAPTAVLLAETNRLLVRDGPFRKMVILGRLDAEWDSEWPRMTPLPERPGLIPREEVRLRQLSGAALLSADFNSACPNAVIEAMAAGLPVLGLDTGALHELTESSGVIAPYGGDSWKLELPSGVIAMAAGARDMMQHWQDSSRRARSIAERKFDMPTVAAAYREVLAG